MAASMRSASVVVRGPQTLAALVILAGTAVCILDSESPSAACDLVDAKAANALLDSLDKGTEVLPSEVWEWSRRDFADGFGVDFHTEDLTQELPQCPDGVPATYHESGRVHLL